MKLLPLLLMLLLATTSSSAQETIPARGFDSDIATAIKYAIQLRGRMRDPDSFAVDRVFSRIIEPLTKQAAKRLGKKAAASYANSVGTTQFCFEFGSRNGYGGMNRGLAIESDGNVVPFDQNILDLIGGTCAAWWPIRKEITAEITAEVARIQREDAAAEAKW